MKLYSFPGIVPLGSIKELPADSCSEIKASEGSKKVDGKYCIYSDRNGDVIEAHCEGKMIKMIIGKVVDKSNKVVDNSVVFFRLNFIFIIMKFEKATYRKCFGFVS